MTKCEFCGSVETGELRAIRDSLNDRLNAQYLMCGKKLPAPYGLSDHYMKVEENSDDLANMHAEVCLCKSTRGWFLMFHYYDGDDIWAINCAYLRVSHCPGCGRKLPKFDIEKFRKEMEQKEVNIEEY